MRGLITTLNKQRSHFVPVSAPIVYLKKDQLADGALGVITPDNAAYEGYRRVAGRDALSRATRAFSINSPTSRLPAQTKPVLWRLRCGGHHSARKP